jgi:RNA polymerase sigma-70 factor, ECF subfamily
VKTLALELPGFASVWAVMGAESSPESQFKEQVLAARRGDHDAFAALIRSVQRPVFGLCARLLQTQAEASEIAQETFLRAYRNLDRYDENKPFDIWVLSIARNLCLDLLRRRSRGHGSAEDLEKFREVLPSGDANAEQALVDEERREYLEKAMRALSTDDREVLALYYVQNRTTKQIAEVMKVAPGTVMARLFRAREKLRKMMPQLESGEP